MKKMILVLVLAFMFVSCGGDDGTDTNETNDSDDTSSDNTSGDKFPLENNGTKWSMPADTNMTVVNGAAYCDDLGGRLPSVSELRSLIKDWSKTMTGGECEVTDSCNSSQNCLDKALCNGSEDSFNGKYSVFGENTKGSFWSSTKDSYKPETSHNWIVDFNNGGLESYYEGADRGILCISK